MSILLFRKFLSFCSMIMVFQCLTSCGFTAVNRPTPPAKHYNTTLNAINEKAFSYKAKYGQNYNLYGNIIAKFPHFNLTLFSQKINQNSTIHIYEVSSRDKFHKTHLFCDSKDTEKKHFYFNNLHFYYHSNTNGHINVYMPQQLLALR